MPLLCHDLCFSLERQGTLLIAEVMASKGYRVEPLPRVPRHDTVQVQQMIPRSLLLT